MTPREEATAWLEARGLDVELSVKMGWEPVQKRDRETGEVHTWMKIPYIRDEKPLTHQFRRLDAKEFRFQKGSEAELWNVDVLRDPTLDGASLIIAEGACDGLALLQCGYQRVVAVPGWSDKNLEPERYEPFKRNEAWIRRSKVILVATHADNAGYAMLRAVANFFDEIEVRHIAWPEGCKDANDTLRLKGQEAVTGAIWAAKPVDPPGGLITGFSDLPPRPERKVWRLDYPELDRHMAFRSREFSLLTGTPSSGKTTFAVWCAHHLVRANDIRVGLGLFETDPTEVRLQLLKLNGVEEGDLISGGAVKEARALEKLDRNYRLFHRVDEGDEVHGMKWLKAMVHKLAARDGCNVIIIDPWNEIEHLLEPGESMANYANFALMRIRQWCERYDIHILLTAHPKKMPAGHVPLGYDVADAAAFANKPSFGWTIHLESDDDHGDHVSLTTWKVRSRQHTGCRPGRLKLSFDEGGMFYRPLTTKRATISAC